MNSISDKKLIVIAVVSQNGVYSEGGKIPWHIKEDFEHFKKLTTGNTVVMGRNTWESLPNPYCPLPDRYNTVVTSNQNYVATGAVVVSSLRMAILEAPTEKVFCIGGMRLWYEAMEVATEAWITLVKKDFPITERVTNVASNLVIPDCHWKNFYLKETQKPKKAQAQNEPYFEIYHWAR